MTNQPPSDREAPRLIRILLSGDRAAAEFAGAPREAVLRNAIVGLGFTTLRFGAGPVPVAANDSFPPGGNAA